MPYSRAGRQDSYKRTNVNLDVNDQGRISELENGRCGPGSNQKTCWGNYGPTGTMVTNSALAQFAEGMKGDEDLGQDITMKGQPFHYAQKPGDTNGIPVTIRTGSELPDTKPGQAGSFKRTNVNLDINDQGRVPELDNSRCDGLS
jgi:hypothetical protein